LLVACAPDRAEAILSRIIAAGYPFARIIGDADSGASVVKVHA
jgi:selenide,water dikinase